MSHWPRLGEHVTVADIPPGTFWWKDALDRYTVQVSGTGELMAASKNLRTAILRAREVIDSRKTPNDGDERRR
jgi:hypothetical protein